MTWSSLLAASCIVRNSWLLSSVKKLREKGVGREMWGETEREAFFSSHLSKPSRSDSLYKSQIIVAVGGLLRALGAQGREELKATSVSLGDSEHRLQLRRRRGHFTTIDKDVKERSLGLEYPLGGAWRTQTRMKGKWCCHSDVDPHAM